MILREVAAKITHKCVHVTALQVCVK